MIPSTPNDHEWEAVELAEPLTLTDNIFKAYKANIILYGSSQQHGHREQSFLVNQLAPLKRLSYLQM